MSQYNNVEIIVYRITGRQGVINVPHRYCEECDLAVSVANRVVEEVDVPSVNLMVRPWMRYFWRPLMRGGWHAPVVTINGKVFSQGVVPNFDEFLDAVRRELVKTVQRSEAGQHVS